MDLTNDPFAEAAERHADAPALIGQDGALTYGAWRRRSLSAALRLRAAGIGPGDVLALCMAPSERYLVLLMACFQARIVACPVNPAWPPARIAEALASIGCKAAVADPAFAKAFEACRLLAANDLDGAGPAVEEALPPFDFDAPATVVFTSGSAGVPKAALLGLGNHYQNAVASNQRVPYRTGDRWLLSLPLFHVSGLAVLFRTIAAGATVVLPRDGRDLAAALDDFAPTHASFVPAQLQRLLELPFGIPRLERLRAILLGGSAIPATLVRDCVRHGLNIHLTYGMTEHASQIATTPEGAAMHVLFAGARPLFPEDIAVTEDGEIALRGPALFLGYLTAQGVAKPLADGEWFLTGDIGRFDGEGNLAVCGRKDNMFVSGGENIHPEEIERALCRIVGVKRAVVVPVADPVYGQRPVAFVDPRRLIETDPDGLRAALAETLPRYAMPVACYGWPEEEDAALKVDRAAFAQRAARLRERDTTRE